MDKSLKTYITPQNLAFVGALMMLASLPLGKAAILSIGTIIIIVTGLWQRLSNPVKIECATKYLVLAMIGLWLFSALSFFWTSDVNTKMWLDEIRIKLPFLLLAPALAALPRFSKKQYHALFFIFVFAQSLTALFSIAAYLFDFEGNQLIISKNSSIEIITGINHIYFGITLAFSILLVAWQFAWKIKTAFRWERKLLLLLGVIGFVCLHILTSRTGFVAFYGGAAAMLLYYMVERRAFALGILGLLVLVAVPFLSYQFVPSFRTRVQATVWDIENYKDAGDKLINFSVGARFLTWESCWDLFQQEPIIGLGMADLEGELLKKYKEKGFNIPRGSALKSAHNQYLEHLAGGGMIGFGILLFSILLIPWYFFGKKSAIVFVLISLFAAAMLTESFLERQIGVAFYILFLFLLIKYEPKL